MTQLPIEKVKLFLGLILTKNIDKIELFKQLKKAYGAIHYESKIMDFSHTTYYKKEMGAGLEKQFIAIDPLIPVYTSYQTKLIANKIEDSFRDNNKRKVNIDPGILSAHNVILFTTKNYAHRIPLNKHIYAELTYIYQKKSYATLPWSYPDFETQAYKDYFQELRKQYLHQCKEEK